LLGQVRLSHGRRRESTAPHAQRRTASSILPFREIAPMRGLFRHFSVRFLNDAAEEGDRA